MNKFDSQVFTKAVWVPEPEGRGHGSLRSLTPSLAKLPALSVLRGGSGAAALLSEAVTRGRGGGVLSPDGQPQPRVNVKPSPRCPARPRPPAPEQKAMVQLQWHDGTVRNVHVDLPILFEYQVGAAWGPGRGRAMWVPGRGPRPLL